jgi:hypothetical protein
MLSLTFLQWDQMLFRRFEVWPDAFSTFRSVTRCSLLLFVTANICQCFDCKQTVRGKISQCYTYVGPCVCPYVISWRNITPMLYIRPCVYPYVISMYFLYCDLKWSNFIVVILSLILNKIVKLIFVLLIDDCQLPTCCWAMRFRNKNLVQFK